MQERRRFKRLNVDLPVTLRWGGRLIPATALNVSSGGVCLNVGDAEIDMDGKNKVEVIIDISKEERDVSLRGEITRVEHGEDSLVGIKFTNLYTIGHQTLDRFINRSKN